MANKVLVIEDSATDAKIVSGILKDEGILVEIATSGEEGIKEARKTKPDLIVLDLVLPDMSGYDVCRKIKEDKSLNKTLVVVLSIKDDVNDITRAFREGADDYIIKPAVPDFLVRKIKLYLRIKD